MVEAFDRRERQLLRNSGGPLPPLWESPARSQGLPQEAYEAILRDSGPRSKSLGYVGESGLLSVADLHASDAEEPALGRGLGHVLADGL